MNLDMKFEKAGQIFMMNSTVMPEKKDNEDQRKYPRK